MTTLETTPETPQAYPTVPAHPAFPALEHEVLDFWAADGTFEASVDARPTGDNGANEFVFYDGPPFANGLPHYGHLLTGYVKDVVPRYQTMRGRRVERRFGWDTHGLPAEVETEHQLGIKHKSEIEEMGVAAFNDACRESVLRYTDEWRAYVTRQARWVDFDHDYKTLDLDYMESRHVGLQDPVGQGSCLPGLPRALVLLALRAPRCRPPRPRWTTSTATGRTRPSPSGCGCPRPAPTSMRRYALVWTTTPWTLPSNLAIAVNPDVDYVLVERPTRRRTPASATCSPPPGVARVRPGAGRRPERAADALPAPSCSAWPTPRRSTSSSGRENAHRVLAADYVTTEDGTGLVHIAPGVR